MKDDDMDRILSKPDELVPSSGFTASVMEAVRREAAAPPPIPFPWKRALPGLLLVAFALALIIVVCIVAITQFSTAPAASQQAMPWTSMMPLVSQGAFGTAAGWTLLALVLTFLSVTISMRLAKA